MLNSHFITSLLHSKPRSTTHMSCDTRTKGAHFTPIVTDDASIYSNPRYYGSCPPGVPVIDRESSEEDEYDKETIEGPKVISSHPNRNP